jgi:tRNA-modifying protein YgfZ
LVLARLKGPTRFCRLNIAFFDLSLRVKLRVTGIDRERFLNGQLSNDVRKATESHAIQACILNAKGKLNACVFAGAEGESYFLDADHELRESLQLRLERYIIADDVQLADESDRWSIFHVLGSRAPALTKEFKVRSVTRFTGLGHDVWGESARHDELFRQLSQEFTFYGADHAEVYRIENGIPRWGHELTEEIIPIEANLEERTIDYEKGCYIGQEVISRIKMSGQTNKRLCGLTSMNASPLSPGMKLFSVVEEAKEVGWITSATWSERLGKQIALGFVKRGFNQVLTQLDAISPGKAAAAVRVEIVNLLFE